MTQKIYLRAINFDDACKYAPDLFQLSKRRIALSTGLLWTRQQFQEKTIPKSNHLLEKVIMKDYEKVSTTIQSSFAAFCPGSRVDDRRVVSVKIQEIYNNHEIVVNEAVEVFLMDLQAVSTFAKFLFLENAVCEVLLKIVSPIKFRPKF